MSSSIIALWKQASLGRLILGYRRKIDPTNRRRVQKNVAVMHAVRGLSTHMVGRSIVFYSRLLNVEVMFGWWSGTATFAPMPRYGNSMSESRFRGLTKSERWL